MAEISKHPDYFSGGIIDNRDPLSLPPGFAIGAHPDNPEHLILHYDKTIVKDMHLAQMERRKDPSFVAVDHYYFPDNPDVEKLWGLGNKKAFISNSVSSPAKKNKAAQLLAKAEKDFLVDAFFNEAGNLNSPKEYNFDYYGNDPAAKEIFKEKLAALSKTINEAFPGDPEQAEKVSNFIHDAILRNRKDLSCFIEGKELAALNRLTNLSPEEFRQFHEITIRPTHYNPKCVMSFSEVESSYSSYTSFVKGLDVAQSKKDKLLQLLPTSNRDEPCCNIGFEDPRTALARIQYIISTASDQSEQIDKINSVKLDSYDSAFYMKRYADLPIVDQECNSMSKISKADLNLTNEQILAKAHELSLLDSIKTGEQFDESRYVNANLNTKCSKGNIFKERVSGGSARIYNELQLLSNVG